MIKLLYLILLVFTEFGIVVGRVSGWVFEWGTGIVTGTGMGVESISGPVVVGTTGFITGIIGITNIKVSKVKQGYHNKVNRYRHLKG